MAKNSPFGHRPTTLSGYIFATKHVSTVGKNLLNSNTSCTCVHNMANLGIATAEIGSGVWGTSGNFNGFRILSALLHGTLVLGVEQRAPPIFDRAAITLGSGPHSSRIYYAQCGHC